MRRTWTYAVALAALLAPLAHGPAAQELRITGVRAWSPHDLIGNPAGAAVTFSGRGERVVMRVGFEWVESEQRGTGIACGGFIAGPDRCPTEPLRIRGRSQVFTLGFAEPLVRRLRARLDLAQSLRFGELTGNTRGLETGNTLSASKEIVGLDLGLEASVVPRAGSPFSLHAATRYGAVVPPFTTRAEDAYEPFNDGFGVLRVELGMGFRWGRR